MKTKSINIHDSKISYLDNESTGPVILFIHGNSLSNKIFKKQFKSELLSKFRLIAIDLPGHGDSSRSTKPEKDYSFEGMAILIKEFIDHLKLQNITMVGFSLGGHITIQSLSKIGTIKSIMIIGTPPIGIPPRFDLAFNPNPVLTHLFEDEIDDTIAADIAKAFSNPFEYPDFLFEDLLKADPLFRLEIGRAVFSGGNTNEIEALKQFKGNKCIVVGEKDALVNASYIEELGFENLFGNHIQVIEHSGHIVSYHQTDLFNKLLYGFVSQ